MLAAPLARDPPLLRQRERGTTHMPDALAGTQQSDTHIPRELSESSVSLSADGHPLIDIRASAPTATIAGSESRALPIGMPLGKIDRLCLHPMRSMPVCGHVFCSHPKTGHRRKTLPPQARACGHRVRRDQRVLARRTRPRHRCLLSFSRVWDEHTGHPSAPPVQPPHPRRSLDAPAPT